VNILLFGLDLHANRIYLNYLSKQKPLKKLIVVDLKRDSEKIVKILNEYNFDYELLLFEQY
jgi:hypothetical protein